jgi:hypothetical protein
VIPFRVFFLDACRIPVQGIMREKRIPFNKIKNSIANGQEWLNQSRLAYHVFIGR